MHKKDLVKIYYCHRGNLHSDKNEALWSYHKNIDTNRLFWCIRTGDWYCFRIKIVVKFLRNAGNEHYQTTRHTLEVHMHVYRCTVVKTINFTLLSSFIWWKYTATCIIKYQIRYQNKSTFIWSSDFTRSCKINVFSTFPLVRESVTSRVITSQDKYTWKVSNLFVSFTERNWTV